MWGRDYVAGCVTQRSVSISWSENRKKFSLHHHVQFCNWNWIYLKGGTNCTMVPQETRLQATNQRKGSTRDCPISGEGTKKHGYCCRHLKTNFDCWCDLRCVSTSRILVRIRASEWSHLSNSDTRAKYRSCQRMFLERTSHCFALKTWKVWHTVIFF